MWENCPLALTTHISISYMYIPNSLHLLNIPRILINVFEIASGKLVSKYQPTIWKGNQVHKNETQTRKQKSRIA